MTTKQYLKKYHLEDSQYANHFNTDLFLQDLNEDFLARIEHEKEVRLKSSLEYTYRIFQVIIQEMQNKFCAISNKKAGGPLRQELWNAFYAKYIIPVRERDFPEEHAKIQAKREAYDKNKIREQIIAEEFGKDNYSIMKARAKVSKEDLARFNALKDKIDQMVEARYTKAQSKGPRN